MLKREIILILFILLQFLWGCEVENHKEQKIKKGREGLVKQYHKNGVLASEINYSNKKKHGLAKYYYNDGKLRSEVFFKDDIKHGEAKLYYEDGQLFQATNYVEGKKDGIQKKYRDDGQLMAEIPYKMDQPGLGLVEYTIDGSPKSKYPKLIVETVDHVVRDNQYIVRARFSERMRDVMYYIGDLHENKYLHQGLLRIAPKKGGLLELTYTLPPGTFLMEKINIVAVGYTKLKNPLVVQKTINLAVENRGY